MNEISKLHLLIEEIQLKYPGCIIFLRGDSNVNVNNKDRSIIFNDFIKCFNFVTIPLHHKTYHHFVGNGLYDSAIDVIMHTMKAPNYEVCTDIICRLDNGLVERGPR